MKLHNINADQRLYVIKAGDGFSCYGFDVLNRKALTVADWLRGQPRYTGRQVPQIPAELGTAEHFAACAEMMERGAEFNRMTGARCQAELVPALVGLEGKRVEAEYLGERVRFTVGKSTGWMPVHMRIRGRASGGEALLAQHVKNVRIVRA